jgi:hypothetical protein
MGEEVSASASAASAMQQNIGRRGVRGGKACIWKSVEHRNDELLFEGGKEGCAGTGVGGGEGGGGGGGGGGPPNQ